jgi:arylsulfatase A-like enzyme
MGSKVLPYEEGARTPLIILDPRQSKNGKIRKTNSLTGNVDITATILDLAGLSIPSIYDGKSLVPVLDDSKTQVRATLPIVQVWGPDATHCLTVMDDQYKYIYWYYKDPEKGLYPTEELFNIKDDPYEMKNLVAVADSQSQLEKMRNLYDLQLEHWKKKGVKYNDYAKYGELFDRNN